MNGTMKEVTLGGSYKIKFIWLTFKEHNYQISAPKLCVIKIMTISTGDDLKRLNFVI